MRQSAFAMDKDPPARVDAASQPGTPERLTALVADTDEFSQMALAAVLSRRFGFRKVLETTRFEEALALVATDPSIQLALVDLAIPGIDGPASLAALRDVRPDLVVAAMAAAVSREDVLAAVEAGLHGYVPKSDGLPVILGAITTILSGAIFVPSAMARRDAAGAPRLRSVESVPRPDALTSRQLDVLRLIVEGRTNKEIARILGLGEGTVKAHVAALLRVLGVQNRSAAAVTGSRILSAA